jgi:hypothetical protein
MEELTARIQADIDKCIKQRESLRTQAEKDLAYLTGRIEAQQALLKPTEPPAETVQEAA